MSVHLLDHLLSSSHFHTRGQRLVTWQFFDCDSFKRVHVITFFAMFVRVRRVAGERTRDILSGVDAALVEEGEVADGVKMTGYL